MTELASLTDLETPCLIADRSRITTNAQRMLARAATHGFNLRPHVKTTKSTAIAALAHGGNKGPVTVSTLKEAEYFLRGGFADITYAVGITPNKFSHAAHLLQAGADLKLLLTDVRIARELAAFADANASHMKVLVEIDSGEHRTGFLPESPDLLECAAVVSDSNNLTIRGLLTHGGHSYQCQTVEEISRVAEEERQSLLAARGRLGERGIDIDVLSSGSTPTAVHGENFEGITEMRPGVYLAGDLFQAQIGSCNLDDVAVSVLAAVVGHDRRRNRLVIDAGGLALSKDRSTEKSPIDYGYGLLTRVDGSRFDADLIVAGVHQEHGEVESSAPLPFDELPPGSLVRVLPNHVCMTAAAYDCYHVVEGDGITVLDTWEKTGGW